MKPKVKPATMILRFICAMVFLSVGFAHRIPVALSADSPAVAYSLPDGSFADLCIADQGRKQMNPAGDCEACRLAGAVILPTPCDRSWLVRHFVSLGPIVSVALTIRSQHLLDRPRLRGPPQDV
jgi:hypothetical protein